MLETGKQYIYNILDLTMVEKKITSKHYLGVRWFKKDAALGCMLYKNFLCLSLKHYNSADIIVPSEEIDEIWHNHILDTKKYFLDCQHIFGEYLHHYPYFGIDKQTNQRTLKRAFLRSQELYFQEFGEYY